jgi:hypothetical protein
MNYLIWSNEHEAWWGPGECGYVTVISKAGRYPLERAGQIVKQANIVQDLRSIEPHEVMVLAPEWTGHMEKAARLVADILGAKV